jgi:hypothetical protein
MGDTRTNCETRTRAPSVRRCGDAAGELNALRSSAHVVELYFQPRGGEIPWYTDVLDGRRDRPD